MVVFFVRSERALRKWLDTGFGTDAELLEMIRTGTELRFLEKHIGAVGMRILSPLLHTSPRDLWQLHHLKGETPA